MTENALPGEFLHLRGVNVAQGDKIVLHDINLTIQSGEHAVLLGPNGCGKSTLIQTITCAIYPIVQPGMEIRIYGRPRWDLSHLRKHFGVVSTDLPGEKTPVTTGLNVTIAGFFSASTLWPNLKILPEMRDRAWEALERMEATYLADRLVGHMSAGEKRRIMIARSLVHRPEMLLLDEPSNALDLAAQRDLRRILQALAKQGTGILLVTHHLSDILPEIERVILMRDGRIFRDGHRRELLKPEILSDLFKTPVQTVEREGFLYSY